GIFTGIFAKESVIGTLNSLYAQINNDEATEEQAPFSLADKVQEALATIPDNLQQVAENFFDPLGFKQTLADGDIATIQQDLDVDNHAVTQMHLLFGSSSAAIAYLIFILLYTPCAAALGATYRETGLKWMLLVAVWTF